MTSVLYPENVSVYWFKESAKWDIDCPSGVTYNSENNVIEKMCRGQVEDIIPSSFRASFGFSTDDLFDSRDLAIALGTSANIYEGSDYATERQVGPGQGNDSSLGDDRAEWHIVRLGGSSAPFSNTEAFRTMNQEVDDTTADFYLGATDTGLSDVSPYANSGNEFSFNDTSLGTIDISSLAGGDVDEFTYSNSESYSIQGSDPIMPKDRGEAQLVEGETVALVGVTYDWGDDVIDTSSGNALADANRTGIIDSSDNEINRIALRLEVRPSTNADNELMVIRLPLAINRTGSSLDLNNDPNNISEVDMTFSNIALPGEDMFPKGVIEIATNSDGVTLA